MRISMTTGTRSTRPESVIGASGTILFVLSFLPWWGTITTRSLRLGESGRLPSASGHFNAYFGYGWMLELAIGLGVAAVVLVLGRRASTRRLPRWLYFWIGLSMTVLMLASIIRGPVDSGFEGVARIEVSRGPGVAVGLVPCALITLAGLGFARNQARGRR
jgi:predicted small integral membrane protein